MTLLVLHLSSFFLIAYVNINLLSIHVILIFIKFTTFFRFIGELFKLGMLTENIMHDCIFRLLKARDDDSLLSLCNLVTTVGKHLDTEKAKVSLFLVSNFLSCVPITGWVLILI